MKKTVNLQVDVFVKDDEIDEVRQSAHLGNQVMRYDEDEDEYSCVGVYNRPNSAVPVSFVVYALGTPIEREVIVAGMHDEVKDSPPINALTFLDEPEKLAALTEEEKALLSHITALELKAIAIEAHEDDKPGGTPLQNAVIAILQHPDVPEAQTISVHNTEMQVGNRADGADVVLTIGNDELDCDSKEYSFCEYKQCDDKRELYRYTWMGVDKSILDELE